MTVRPRILCILSEFPWPPHGGYRARSVVTLEGLTEIGDVDLLVLGDTIPVADLIEPTVRLASVEVIQAPVRRSPRQFIRWLSGDFPRSVSWRDWSAARAGLRMRPMDHYDLAWFGQSEVAGGVGDLVPVLTVIDLDDLQWVKIAHRLSTSRIWGRNAGGSDAPKDATRRLFDRIDRARWFELQHSQAAAAAAVVVCSELDRNRLGRANVAVVPNSYPDQGTPRDRGTLRRTAPVIAMVGVYSYPPNREGAGLFVRRILPLVRDVCPGAIFHLIGRDIGAVGTLGRAEGVVLVGEVSSIPAALANCDLVVIPIVTGGGTRIKVIEAFACGVPVVSTSVGCEGLAVTNGEHLLIADDVVGFADSCAEVLTDDDLRRRLVSAGHDLWRRRYRRHAQRDAVSTLARGLLKTRR